MLRNKGQKLLCNVCRYIFWAWWIKPDDFWWYLICIWVLEVNILIATFCQCSFIFTIQVQIARRLYRFWNLYFIYLWMFTQDSLCYQWGCWLPCETPIMNHMELPMISSFHHCRHHNFDPTILRLTPGSESCELDLMHVLCMFI